MKKFLTSIFFQHLAFGFTIPVLILWERQNGLSFLDIGLIQSLGLMTAFIFDMPSSYFADRFGKKIQILAGLACLCSSFAILIFSHSFIQFLIMDMVQKIGFALLSGTEESFIHDLHAKNDITLTKLLGKMSIADEGGTMLGLGLSSIIGMLYGIHFTFIVAFFCVCFAFICMIKIPEKRKHKTTPLRRSFFVQLSPLSKHTMLMIGFLFLCNAFLSERGEMIFQASLQNAGMQISIVGFVYMFAKSFSILGSSLSYAIERYLGVRSTIVLIIVLQCLAFFLLLPANGIGVIAALSVYFFSENVLRNVRGSYVLRTAPQSLKTTALSAVSLSSSLVLSAIQPIVGFLTSIHIANAIAFLVVLKVSSLLWIVATGGFLRNLQKA